MIKTFDICARAIFILIALLVAQRIWQFFSPRPIDSYIHGGLIGAEQTETLFTGFATLPVLYFSTGDDLHLFDPSAADQNIPEKVNGFCYHLYDLALGYDNIAKTVNESMAQSDKPDWHLPDPEVLAANIVESRHGGALSRYKCDALDYAPTEEIREARMRRFVDVLASNQQWQPHRDNAQAILLGLDKELREARLRFAEKQIVSSTGDKGHFAHAALGPQFGGGVSRRRDASSTTPEFASGSLGSLKLTFATIALFTRDKNWFFQKNEFYVRQDNAEVTYGTDFYHDFSISKSLIGPSRLVVTLPPPRVLAVNRFTLALKTHPVKFDPSSKINKASTPAQDEILQDPIERALTGELQRQMDRVEDQAIMVSKGLIADQIRALMHARSADVTVKFERSYSSDDDRLFQLLRRMESSDSNEVGG